MGWEVTARYSVVCSTVCIKYQSVGTQVEVEVENCCTVCVLHSLY